MSQRVAIVGIGQTYFRSKRPDVNIPEMCHEAVRAALEDANLEAKDIDTVVYGNMELFEGCYQVEMWQSDYIGGYLKPGTRVATGGTTGASTGVTAIEYAASGLADVVLALAFEKQSEGDSRLGLALAGGQDPTRDRTLFFGAIGPSARAATAYMRKSGCKEEHAAMLRLRIDRCACKNPHAHLKLGLETIEEVLNSPYLVTPLRLLDMCPTSEGACAIIVASEEKARKITNKPVWVKDWEVMHNFDFGSGGFDGLTHTEASRILYKRNGITNPRRDLSCVELYDPATYIHLDFIECLGLCEKGEAWKLEEKGFWDLDGECPTNPSGGVVATNAIGSTAMVRQAEVALQLRGDAGDYQISRVPKLGLATALGASSWCVLTLLSNTLD